jgi:hypothetical protein
MSNYCSRTKQVPAVLLFLTFIIYYSDSCLFREVYFIIAMRLQSSRGEIALGLIKISHGTLLCNLLIVVVQ